MFKVKYLGTILFLAFLSHMPAQSCLNNGISFTNQEQIDNFKVNYPDCISIEGDIIISDTNISNLDSLNNIITIKGTLYLDDNNSISLLGLQNLRSVGGLTIKDDGLNHFQGLENLEIIQGDLRIEDCYGISTLGLSSLMEVQGDFKLYDNDGLSIEDLSALESISGNLIISDNEVPSLEGLATVKEIGGQLIIRDNATLSSLEGLDSIDANSITELFLEASDSLSFCSVKSICDYLRLDAQISTIGQNLTGCNTANEILALCSTVTSYDNLNNSRIQVYPNPVVDVLQIDHNLVDISKISVLHSNGLEVIHFEYDTKELNVNRLIPGMYILAIVSGNATYHFRFMKLTN